MAGGRERDRPALFAQSQRDAGASAVALDAAPRLVVHRKRRGVSVDRMRGRAEPDRGQPGLAVSGLDGVQHGDDRRRAEAGRDRAGTRVKVGGSEWRQPLLRRRARRVGLGQLGDGPVGDVGGGPPAGSDGVEKFSPLSAVDDAADRQRDGAEDEGFLPAVAAVGPVGVALPAGG